MLTLLTHRDNPGFLREDVAFDFYRKAADKKQAQAAFKISVGHLRALPSAIFKSIDKELGVEWMEKSSEYGSELAMLEMYLYENSEGGASGEERARIWLLKMSDLKNIPASVQLIANDHTQSVSEKIDSLISFIKKYPDSQVIGYIYYLVALLHVKAKKTKEAWVWLKKGWNSTTLKSPVLASYIGSYLYSIENFEKKKNAPVKWFKLGWAINNHNRASEQANGIALKILGDIYLAGNIVEKNFIQSKLWYLRTLIYEKEIAGLHGLGRICAKSQDFQCALQYYKKTLEYLQGMYALPPRLLSMQVTVTENIAKLYVSEYKKNPHNANAHLGISRWLKKSIQLGSSLAMLDFAVFSVKFLRSPDYFSCFVYSKLAQKRNYKDYRRDLILDYCGSYISDIEKEKALLKVYDLDEKIPKYK